MYWHSWVISSSICTKNFPAKRTLYVIVHIEIYKSTMLAMSVVVFFSLAFTICMLFISLPMFSLCSLACYFLSFHFWFSHLSFAHSFQSPRLVFLISHTYFFCSFHSSIQYYTYIYLCLQFFNLLFIIIAIFGVSFVVWTQWSSRYSHELIKLKNPHTHSFIYLCAWCAFSFTQTHQLFSLTLSLSLSYFILYIHNIFIIIHISFNILECK